TLWRALTRCWPRRRPCEVGTSTRTIQNPRQTTSQDNTRNLGALCVSVVNPSLRNAMSELRELRECNKRALEKRAPSRLEALSFSCWQNRWITEEKIYGT